MIKPPKAEVITDGASRKKVYAYDYDALWRYCSQLETEKKELAVVVGQCHKMIRGYQKDVNQYSKLSNDSIELDSNNKKVEVVLLDD